MNIIISNSSNKPIYEQIYSQIKAQIMKDELTDGEALPSIRHLAKELKISVITTKRAYEELESHGFIETVIGKGSFVAKKNLDMIRENELKDVESLVSQAVDIAKKINLSEEELNEIVKIIYLED